MQYKELQNELNSEQATKLTISLRSMSKQNILADPFMGSIIIQMINNCNFRSPIHFMMSILLISFLILK